MPALADGREYVRALEFYQKLGTPVSSRFSVEAYVAPGKRIDRSDKNSFHITLLAMNYQGYKNLLHLSSTAFLDGLYYKAANRPRRSRAI